MFPENKDYNLSAVSSHDLSYANLNQHNEMLK